MSRLAVWFDGENESLNTEFIWDNILVKHMSVSTQNYNIPFAGLLF
jgi:hypothetical protein